MNALEQRRSAIAEANRRRCAAARFKERLTGMPRWHAANLLAVELANGFPDAPGTPIGPLLLAIPFMGDSKVGRLLKSLGLDRKRTVRSLTEGRRLGLALRLRTLAREWENRKPRYGQSERRAA